jgi:hypothetical protein
MVGVLGLPTPLEDRQAMGAVGVPILLKGACGDHWSGSALLVTVWMGLPTYDEKNACAEAKRKSTLSDLQQLHERLHFRSGLSVTIAEFQRAKINDRRGRPSDRTRVKSYMRRYLVSSVSSLSSPTALGSYRFWTSKSTHSLTAPAHDLVRR